ncbi:hypothetical protein [Sinorhizobium fredii]|uniref:hypothetical protein n=1 Tax=Rhizobium fredii TaxID=380 RepID=UPI00351675E6
MKDRPLHASTEKVARAERKFRDLMGMINAYLDRDTYSVTAEQRDGRIYVIARLEKELPSDIAFETVEIIGHLRGALEKIVMAMVASNGRGTAGVGFPFGGLGKDGQPEPFPGPRFDDMRKKLTEDQWDFLAGHKPYPGGNDLLWAVNELANVDKHKDGLVELQPDFNHSALIGRAGSNTIMTNVRVGVEEDQWLVAAERGAKVLASYDAVGLNNRMDFEINKHVVFGDGLSLRGQNVLSTLNKQIRLTKSMVALCKQRFF